MRLGLFYDTATSFCSYWHLPFVEEFGFGGSHSDPNFNRALMAKWLKHLGKTLAYEFLALFVVSWIGCDGSLDIDYISILVAEKVEGKGDSIPDWMEDVLCFLLGNQVEITPYLNQEEEWNKPFLDMRLSRKRDRLLFGFFLTPYVSKKCDDPEEEDEFKGFLPYYKWNALVDLEELYYKEGGNPNRKPDNAGAWEKLIDLNPDSW